MKKTYNNKNHSSKIKRFCNKSISKEKNAQLLLLGGIIITVILITSASIAISLSNVSIPLDKTSSIKNNYDNIRKQFGIALKDNVKDYLEEFGPQSSKTLVEQYFEDVKSTFSFFIETYNDNYFDATITDIWNDGSGIEIEGVLKIELTYSDNDEEIVEEVVYDLR